MNQLLIAEFTKDTEINENHALIASLPVRTLWTTNYDTLLEQALKAAHKRVDTKISPENFSTTMPDRDAVLYKMHGDVTQVHEAVLTKEDYEMFDDVREAFSIALKGDLFNKTFLFLGFSFTDPNIDHILSRIRGLLGKNQRSHFCVMKQPSAPADPADRARYEYECRKLELRVVDLSRYSIHTVLVDKYEDIPGILRELQKRAHLKDIFVSGSAHDYSPLGPRRIGGLADELGAQIIAHNFNLVSGLGLGLGAQVAHGALRERYSTGERRGLIRFFPFPRQPVAGMTKDETNTRFRQEMLSNVGFSIFLCGNRENPDNGRPEMGRGVMEEFEITRALGRFPIPIGATGWAAREIWNEIMSDRQKYYGGVDLRRELEILGDVGRANAEYLGAIFEIVRKLAA